MRSCVCSTELQSTIRFCEIGGSSVSNQLESGQAFAGVALFFCAIFTLQAIQGNQPGLDRQARKKRLTKSLFNTYSSQVLTQQLGSNEISRDVELGTDWKGWIMCDRSEPGRGWTWGHGVTRTLYCRIED